MPLIRHGYYFYPRSPCGERRVSQWTGTWNLSFLSTLSLRRATIIKISFLFRPKNFYPRSPCGERQAAGAVQFQIDIFLSTLSLRRATNVQPLGAALGVNISIHALLAESDNSKCLYRPEYIHFYPRSPCGERLFKPNKSRIRNRFLSTLSLRRATLSR